MDQKSQEYLNEILKKNPQDLTEVERRFLRARQSYLKQSQFEEYRGVIEQVEKETTSYEDLLKRAKELGYKGKRLTRAKLKQFITENS